MRVRIIDKFNLDSRAKILLYVSLIASFAIGLLGPIYAIFVEEIGGSILDAGIAYAIFSIFTGILIISFGSTKFFARNTRKIVVLGYFILALGNLGYLLVKSPIHLFIVQVVLGIAVGILEPAWDSIYAARLSEKQECKRWSLWSGSTYFLVGIAAIFGGFLASTFSFKILFLIMGALSVISAIISLAILKEKYNKPKK